MPIEVPIVWDHFQPHFVDRSYSFRLLWAPIVVLLSSRWRTRHPLILLSPVGFYTSATGAGTCTALTCAALASASWTRSSSSLRQRMSSTIWTHTLLSRDAVSMIWQWRTESFSWVWTSVGSRTKSMTSEGWTTLPPRKNLIASRCCGQWGHEKKVGSAISWGGGGIKATGVRSPHYPAKVVPEAPVTNESLSQVEGEITVGHLQHNDKHFANCVCKSTFLKHFKIYEYCSLKKKNNFF